MSPKQRINGLPPYVYKRARSYVLRLYVGANEPMRSIELCPITAPISEVWKQYELHVHKRVKNLQWLFREYTDSRQFKKKAESTIKMQLSQAERICSYKMKSGKVFGTAEIKKITSGAIRKYLDAREADGSPVSGNRETALISSAWNWALERDMVETSNPCDVVKRNKEAPRTRYVTEEEYISAYALTDSTPYLRPAMELAYLCRMRRCEILNSTRAQILEEGFDTLRTKGSRDAITRWSERLTAAINYDAGEVKSLFIIHDARGQKITESAFKSAWTRLKKRMVLAGIEPFNFHDLKAAGVSDFEGDKLAASGHRDAKMLKTYDRKKHSVDATK